jgi:hypothetical protein
MVVGNSCDLRVTVANYGTLGFLRRDAHPGEWLTGHCAQSVRTFQALVCRMGLAKGEVRFVNPLFGSAA